MFGDVQKNLRGLHRLTADAFSLRVEGLYCMRINAVMHTLVRLVHESLIALKILPLTRDTSCFFIL